jgi:hypothetical protein
MSVGSILAGDFKLRKTLSKNQWPTVYGPLALAAAGGIVLLVSVLSHGGALGLPAPDNEAERAEARVELAARAVFFEKAEMAGYNGMFIQTKELKRRFAPTPAEIAERLVKQGVAVELVPRGLCDARKTFVPLYSNDEGALGGLAACGAVDAIGGGSIFSKKCGSFAPDSLVAAATRADQCRAEFASQERQFEIEAERVERQMQELAAPLAAGK